MKKNRLREADPIVEENNINEAPMQASTQEVADAQSNVEAPVEDATMEEAPQDIEVPEGSEDLGSTEIGGVGEVGGMGGGAIDSSPEFGSGIKVNPETVSMEIELPTDQLASAVAQATGDVVPAETAPDVEQAKEEELVAQQQEEAEPSMEDGTEPSPLETESPMGEESMEQSIPADNLENEPQQPMGEKKMSPSKKVDMKFKKKLDSIINKGVENMAKSLKESEEDLEVEMPEGLKIDGDSVYCNGEYVGFIGNSKNCIYVSTKECKEAEDYFLAKDWIVKEKYDFGKPFYESEEKNIEEPMDDYLDTEEDFGGELPEGYEEEGVTDEGLEDDFLDVSDEDISDFMGRLQGFLNNEETTPSDVSDALRTSADFMDVVGGNAPSSTPLADTIKDSEEFDFDSLLDGDYEDGEIRDEVKEEPVRRAPRDFDDNLDDDFEEALVRKPCKFPKDRTSIKESRNRKAQRLQETKISYDLLDGTYKPWSGAVDTWETIEEEGLLEELDSLLEDIYPDGLSESELNDLLWFDKDWVFEQLGISDGEEFIGDEEDEEYEESLKVKNKGRIKESHKSLKKLKEGPGGGYTLRIEDLELLKDTVKIVSSEGDSCTFTVDVRNNNYKFSASHSYWGGEDWAQISGTLTGIYTPENEEDIPSEFIDDDDSVVGEKEDKYLINDIKSSLPRYVTVDTIYSRGWFSSVPDKDFTLEDNRWGIADLNEPTSYYFEFISFEGHSDDLGVYIESMMYGEDEDYDESQKIRNKKRLSETTRKPKLKEASEILYPAGSGPSESSALYRKSTSKDSNLVRAHERVIEGRRNAVRNFHESVRGSNTPSNRRFNEALRTPVKSTLNYKDDNTSSWKNNRFIDKYEESQKLDFNILLNEGYLG